MKPLILCFAAIFSLMFVGCNRANVRGIGNSLDQSTKVTTSVALPGGTSTINNYYQGLTKEQLIDELKLRDERIEKLEVLSQRNVYKPLSPALLDGIVKEISGVGQIKRVEVSSMNGGMNEGKVKRDLVQLLVRAGIESFDNGDGIGLGGAPQSQITVTMSKSTFEAADKLMGILKKYIHADFHGSYNDTLENGVIQIQIYGELFFQNDGTVVLAS